MKKGQEKQMLGGLVVVFVLFQWAASSLGSMRGEAGVMVGLIVVGALLLVERLLFASSLEDAAEAIGLGRSTVKGIIVAIVIAKMMFLSAALFAWQTGATFTLFPDWQWLIIGLFFQAGIAEEALFRGYLFRHLRQRHTFAKAVFFAAIPFVLVHLILFYSLPWSLAVASILLAIAMSFPLSKLFELGGGTIWAPAIVHFAAQAVAKLLVAEGANAWLFPFFVIAVSAIAPLLVYLAAFFSQRSSALPTAGTALLLLAFMSEANGEKTPENDLWICGLTGAKRARRAHHRGLLQFRSRSLAGPDRRPADHPARTRFRVSRYQHGARLVIGYEVAAPGVNRWPRSISSQPEP